MKPRAAPRPTQRLARARALVRAVLLIGAFASASGMTPLASAARSSSAWPSYEDVRREHRPSDGQLLDRHGEVLHRQRLSAQARRGEWVALADISPALRDAILKSEDRRFYEHSGVDWRAASAAAWGALWHGRTRGASTLTMQLAGLLDEDLRRAGPRRDLAQKLGQTMAASELERHWRKDQILEAYLNLVPFRGETIGIDALSRTLFAKAPHGLDDREAAIAAVLVRSPNAPSAQVAQRACELLRSMPSGAGQAPDCLSLSMFTTAALQRRAFEPSEGIAPHLAQRAFAQDAGQVQVQVQVRTTLDARLQRVALQSLKRQLRELRGRQVEDGAIVVLDNASGEVLAWVGSSGAMSRAGEVDGVLARRQPGSTLKPLLYAQALAERRLTAASLLDDSSAQIPTASGLYVPQNYDRRFKGQVSVRTALAASLNVPAVRTLVMVTPAAFARGLQASGIALAQSGDHYGYSLALGSAEVTLLDLANGFRTLANGGMAGPTHWKAQAAAAATTSERALDAGAAFIVGDILSDAQARARTFGPDSVLGTRFWSAVKTGTSKDMRDNWAVGWSSRYTVGVWVGNASGAPMWEVSGTSGAAPIWAELMNHLHRQLRSDAPAPPAQVTRMHVRFADGLEAERDEWFLAGTAQPAFELASSSAARDARPRIAAPSDGSIVALDPDIPPANQRLRFASSGPGTGLAWRIDGRTIARGERADWLPWPGRHQVELVNARGERLDTVRVEVRGASVAERKPPR